MAAAIPYVMAAMAAAGAAASANAQANTAKSAAYAANYNAQLDDQKAHAALDQSNEQQETQARKSAMMLGSIAAGAQQSGVGLDGSAGDLYHQSAQNAEMDALNIRYAGVLQSNAFKSQGKMDNYTATTQFNNASQITNAGYINAGAAALSSYGGYTQRQARVDNATNKNS